MDTIQIGGGRLLEGEIPVQGSKNAALPVLAAALLVPGMCVIHNCPQIADTALMIKLLAEVGCQVARRGHTVYVDASAVTSTAMRYKDTEKMRSSVVFMGAMLGRMGEVELGYPGGCVIGERPIDLHLSAIRALGGEVQEEEGCLKAKAGRLAGGHIRFPLPSVGATENAVLAAVLAEGTTILENAAKEPEIDALCDFLRNAGAKIKRDGGILMIEGVTALHPCEYRIPPDRIVAGTYLLACMATGGRVFLRNCPVRQMEALTGIMERMGAQLWPEEQGVGILCDRRPRAPGYIKTEVYPGFPTDLQSPLLAVLALSDGLSTVEETIFENRFRIVEPLKSMGADIVQDAGTVRIRGKGKLTGREVTVCELRGGAGLVIAGLAAEGMTQVRQSSYISRGYEDIVGDFRALGANIAYGGA